MSRRLTLAAVLAIVAIAWTVLSSHHKSFDAAVAQGQALPKVSQEREWPVAGPLADLKWSVDGSRLEALSSLPAGRFIVYSEEGESERDLTLPVPFTYHLPIDETRVAMIGNEGSGISFEIVASDTGNKLTDWKIPSGGSPVRAQMAVHLALSDDRSLLAVAYNAFLPGQPIQIYETSAWRLISTISVPEAVQSGIGYLSFAGNNRRMAFTTHDRLYTVELPSGEVVNSFKVPWGGQVALSPDGNLIGVQELIPFGPVFRETAVKVYRVADGAEIASHEPPAKNVDCAVTAEALDNCVGHSALIWDPKGEFIVLGDVDGSVHLWRPVSKSGDTIIKLRKLVGGIAVAPSGNWLAVGNDGYVSLFKIDRGENK